MTVSTKTHTSTWYEVEADCVDKDNNPVVRNLGIWQGLGSSPQPAWSEYGATHFASLEQAMEACYRPEYLGAFNSHYRGGEIRITRHTRVTSDTCEMVKIVT